MTINLSEFLTRVSESNQEILTNFNTNEESLVSIGHKDGTIVYPISSKFGFDESNKNILISDDSLFDVDFDLSLLCVSNFTPKMTTFERRVDHNYPMKRYYVTFSNVIPNIGVAVPHIDVNSESLTVFKIVDWNSGTPNGNSINLDDQTKIIILDVWEGSSPMTTQQKDNYIKLVSQNFPTKSDLSNLRI